MVFGSKGGLDPRLTQESIIFNLSCILLFSLKDFICFLEIGGLVVVNFVHMLEESKKLAK